MAKRSTLPYFLYNSSSQRGENFKERLSGACKDLFAKGFENILVIGNDTTNLKVADLITAALAQIEGKLVIGPSNDGGVYLLGLSRKQFEEGLLSQVRWESKWVARDLANRAAQFNFSLVSLERKNDLDDHKDFLFYLRSGAANSNLGRSLIRLQASPIEVMTPLSPVSIQAFTSLGISLRAPPLS
ncbi:MAG: DUF2064 domain-containing protein [Bacteroidia bacterium]|nr:DUF2064 domain-containing protein [Bacteroidia bacterium]